MMDFCLLKFSTFVGMLFKKIFIALFCFVVFAACQEEPVAKNGEPRNSANILEFKFLEFTLPEGDISIDSDAKTITILTERNSSLQNLTPVFKLSEKATSTPGSGISISFTKVVPIVVTSEHGNNVSTWYVIVTDKERFSNSLKNDASDLVSFTLNDTIFDIDYLLNRVSGKQPSYETLEWVKPEFSISKGAKLYIDDTEIISGETALILEYKKLYTIKVVSENEENETNFDLDIDSVNVGQDPQDVSIERIIVDILDPDDTKTPGVITSRTPLERIILYTKPNKRYYSIFVPFNIDLSKIALGLETKFSGTTISPSSLSVLDFSKGAQNFTVTSLDASQNRVYVIEIKSGELLFAGDGTNQFAIGEHNELTANVTFTYPYDNVDLENIALTYTAPTGLRLYDGANNIIVSGVTTLDFSKTRRLSLKDANGLLIAEYFFSITK